MSLTAENTAPIAKRSISQRSRVSNGNAVFPRGFGDGRGVWVRRWRDLIDDHVNDLGGPDMLSAFQISLCTRAASLEVQLERLEARMSEGEEVDLDLFGRLLGGLRRVAETLGITRVPRGMSVTASMATWPPPRPMGMPPHEYHSRLS
jgi:hypothetical protein